MTLSSRLRTLAACVALAGSAALHAQSFVPPSLAGHVQAAQYPEEAKRNGIEGTVLVNVRVLETGAAGEVAIARSSGSSLLDAEAVRFGRSAKFVPARRDGVPVATWVRIPVKFVLEDEASSSPVSPPASR